ncbi:hypothetical protein [Gluconobacter oxydans]|uniref:hypothetical protein n=1 Tax=Gluconobacter oxydans TaxID=442 RepID=UPI000780868A|nr:hypothetical protein [Gluconobacter oxydans]
MSSTVHVLNPDTAVRRMEPASSAASHDVPSPAEAAQDDSHAAESLAPEHENTQDAEPDAPGTSSFLSPLMARYEALTSRQKLYGGSGLGACALLLAGVMAFSGSHSHRHPPQTGQEVGMDGPVAAETAPPEAVKTAPASQPRHADRDLAEMQSLGHPKSPAAAPASDARAPATVPVAAVTPVSAPQATGGTAPAPAVVPAPATSVPAAPVQAVPTDPVQTARVLQAAPMSTQQQIDVLQLVTEEARVIERERGEVAGLRQTLADRRKAEEERLSDLNRRMSMIEASHAVSGAENSGTDAASQAHEAARKAREALTAAMNRPAAAPTVAAPAPAAPAPRPAWVHHYRIVAASPQLAMIEDSAAPDGQPRQFEVTTGTVIPGLGPIQSISQRGSAWVIHTAHGDLN